MKVRVYKNLHKNCYSVKAMDGDLKNKVIFHASQLSLSSVSFKVYETGRQRVLKEKQKNVHAYVEGILESIILYQGFTNDFPFYKSTSFLSGPYKVSYNPYLIGSFYETDTHAPVNSCHYCHLNQNGVWCYNI